MNSNRSNGEQVNEIALGIMNVPASSTKEEEAEQYLRMVSLLNHYRHDWMNEIQLLFGYIKLKKYDKLDGLMEKIKVKVQRESLLAKLGAPKLIVYLYSFQAEVKNLPLEIHIEQEVHLHELFADTNRVSLLLIGIMELLKGNAGEHAELEHKLTLHMKADSQSLHISFEYQGILSRKVDERLEAMFRHDYPELEPFVKWDDHHAVIAITVPLNI